MGWVHVFEFREEGKVRIDPPPGSRQKNRDSILGQGGVFQGVSSDCFSTTELKAHPKEMGHIWGQCDK